MARPNLSYLKNLALAVFGLSAGAWSGLSGIGASPLIGPLLIWSIGLRDRRLGAAVILVTLASAATALIAYQQADAVFGVKALVFALFSTIGAVIGAASFFSLLRESRPAVFLWPCLTIALGAYMVHVSNPSTDLSHHTALAQPLFQNSWADLAFCGLLAGLLGRMANLGGVLAPPLLLFCAGFTPLASQGIALLVLVLVSIAPALAYTARNEIAGPPTFWAAFGAILGALLGSRAAADIQSSHHGRTLSLALIEGICLFCLGFYRLFSAWSPAPTAIKPHSESSGGL